MRARATGPASMSTIAPSWRDTGAASFKVPAPRNQAPCLRFYALRLGEAAALVAFLSFAVMWLQWQLGSPGFYPISGDFTGFWTAGQLALEGHAADAYREMPHFFKELALHGDTSRFYIAFFYPPLFLLLCAGFALISYFPALCLWLGSTCACYAAAMRALLPKTARDGAHAWVVFLAYPAVMVNAGFGQNAFLSTALLGGAAVWLDERPELAGLCFGCLAYKPQLGIVVPLALAVMQRWRTFAAATATVLVLAVVSTLVLGTEAWPAFLANMAVAQHNWMEAPDHRFLAFLISIFGTLRLHGEPLWAAYAAQAAVTVTAIVLLVGALLRQVPGAGAGRAEGAAIAACVPLCSPFILEYDLLILAVPMAWLLGEALRTGFRRGEGVALVCAYCAPAVFKITAFDNWLKASVIATTLLLFIMVLRRMTSGSGALGAAAAPAPQVSSTPREAAGTAGENPA